MIITFKIYYLTIYDKIAMIYKQNNLITLVFGAKCILFIFIILIYAVTPLIQLKCSGYIVYVKQRKKVIYIHLNYLKYNLKFLPS